MLPEFGPVRLSDLDRIDRDLDLAAGVKALSTYMGHANITITLDRYGHLMPGFEDEAAGLPDTYLTAEIEEADDAARGADDGLTGEQVANAVAKSRKP